MNRVVGEREAASAGCSPETDLVKEDVMDTAGLATVVRSEINLICMENKCVQTCEESFT